MPLVKLAFWASVAVVFYVYAGYPAVLAAWARLRPRPTWARPATGAPLPAISIVIAARNEGKRLPARLQNLLDADYPADRRQIIVVSDGSTDRTDEVANDFAPAVELVVRPALGKASALNAGVARARHEIVVFADARQMFARDALRRLVVNFTDASVGAVSGELVLDCERPAGQAASTIGDGVGLYWRYEKWLRRHEALVGSTLGVSGAIYAIRRSCWRPLPPDTILDDVLAPMRAVLAGKRVVFDGSAQAFDRAAPDAAVESRRKIRTLAGNYQLISLEPRLLVPFVNPVWLQFVSHKLGRLLVPYALLACFVSSAVLAIHDRFYLVALVAQGAVGLLAAYGGVLESRARRAPVAVPAPRAFSDEPSSSAKKVVNA